MKCQKSCSVLLCVLISFLFALYVVWPPIYFTYVETYRISFIIPYMPLDGSIYILLNYVSMPVSWVLFCASPALFLKKLSVRKRSLFIAITVCSCLLFVGVTTTGILLYVEVYPRIVTSLQESIQQSVSDQEMMNAWNRTQSGMACCGANGQTDWTAAGLSIAPCGGFTLSCLNAITISYAIIWGLSVLGQAAAVFVAAKGTFEFQFVPWASDKWKGVKRGLHFT